MKLRLWPLGWIALLAILAVWWLADRGERELQTSQVPEDVPTTTAASALEQPLHEPGREATTPAVLELHGEARRVAAAPASTAPVAQSNEVVTLQILAQDASGRPVKGAEVWLQLGPHPRPVQAVSTRISVTGEPTQTEIGRMAGFACTDRNGIAEFLSRDSREWRLPAHFAVVADKAVGYATLPPPLTSTRLVVDLLPFARVEVSALESTGIPKPGSYVDVKRVMEFSHDVDRRFLSNSLAAKQTDSRGLAIFDDLIDGEYEFSYLDKSTNTRLHQVVTVALGKQYFVELRFPHDPAWNVCVTGSVVDEIGLPLSKIRVRLRVDGGELTSVFSDEHGNFIYSCRAGKEVELQVGGGMWDDDFEPSSSRVPFGTRDVRLRRARQVDWMAVEIVCRDAITNEIVTWDRQQLQGKRYRAGAPDDRASFQLATHGRTSLNFKARDDWHVVIDAYGYESQDVALAEAMSRGPNGNLLELRLERAPGFHGDH